MKQFIRYFSLVSLVISLVAPPVNTQAVEGDAGQPPVFSAELVSCLKTTLGAVVYTEISSGEREPTDAELDAGDTCFEQFGPKGDPANQPKAEDMKFAPGTEQCLKDKLGEGFRTEFATQKTKEQAKAFRSKTKDCFGKNVVGNQPQIPEEVRSCIVEVVGQATADTMFKSGTPPDKDSDTFKKIEAAKCFKNFGPPPGVGGDRPELPADKKECVEKIMGHSFEDTRTEPTEEIKQQIGKECFGGQGGPGGGPGGPPMPEAVQSCLNDAFGDQLEDLKQGPEFLTDDQKGKAEDCFKKNNFHPGGPGGPGGPDGEGGPPLPPEKQECVEKIMGHSIRETRTEPTEEQKQQIGKECFGGQGGPGGPNGGPQGGPNGGPGANLPPEKRECVERIMGDMSSGPKEPTEEQKQQIGKECFGGQGGPGGPGGPNGEPGGQPGQRNECADKISGGQPPTPEQQQQIGKECFGGQGQPGQSVNSNSGPGGPPPGSDQRLNQPPPTIDGGLNTVRQVGPPEVRSSSSGSGSGGQACADKITNGQPPTPDQQAQIQRECFGAR